MSDDPAALGAGSRHRPNTHVRRVNITELALFGHLEQAQRDVAEAARILSEKAARRDEILIAALTAGHSIRSITDVTGMSVGAVYKRLKETRHA